MDRFVLTILGCSSATPTTRHRPTAQHVLLRSRHFLIDCGEGTQIELRRRKVKFSRIDRILISHLHGDHFFGLIGLISSFHMLERQRTLHIHAPEGLEKLIRLQLRLSNTWLRFPLQFHPLRFDVPEWIFEDEVVRIQSLPLRHSVPCCGFVLEEKPLPRKMNPEALQRYGVPGCDVHRLRKGEDWVSPSGERIPNATLTLDPRPAVRYAFCTDTAYLPELAHWVQGVDLLYHESTFLKSEEALAHKTFHATAEQAAHIAHSAGVGRLLLGHYSVRYEDRSAFLDEARPIFPNTLLAEDGLVVEG